MTPEKYARAMELWDAGWTAPRIAETIGETRAMVEHVMHTHRGDFPYRYEQLEALKAELADEQPWCERARPSSSPLLRWAILEKVRKGKSTTYVENVYGFNHRTVEGWVRRARARGQM